MSGSIYAIQDDKRLVEMAEKAYDSEDLLQKLLADYPSLLAGDLIDPKAPRRWILVRREAELPSEEAGAGRWSVDHLFLDQDAIPTIVEVKRSTDTRIRREVVGQMLDYAANAVVYWPIERIRAMFEAQHGVSAEQVLADFLIAESTPDADQFWDKVKTNLQAGKVRLVFVADYIPPELRRIVEFLNGQMDRAEVLAVEIKQYVGQGLRALVPRVIGTTRPPLVPGRWDETRFIQVLTESHGRESTEVASRILDWAKSRGLGLRWGSGSGNGFVFLFLDHQGRRCWTISLQTAGRIEILFGRMQHTPPFESEAKRRELLARLNAIPGVKIPDTAIARFPSIQITTLRDGVVYKQFQSVLDWIVEQFMALDNT